MNFAGNKSARALLESDLGLDPENEQELLGDFQFRELVDRYEKNLQVSGSPAYGFYEDWDRKLQGRHAARRKIGNNTFAIRYPDFIALRLHATDILKFYPDGSFRVSTGGWNTNVTRNRVNEYMPPGWGIYSQSGTLYWAVPASRNAHLLDRFLFPFTDGDHVDREGLLHTQVPPEPKRIRKRS